MLSEYFSIFLFFMIVIILLFIMGVIPRAFATFVYNKNKKAPYECGFMPFSDSFNTFDIRFYLVGMLFIIFDVEIIFLFPWALSIDNLGYVGFFSMMFFLFILTVGFIYEIVTGALDWS